MQLMPGDWTMTDLFEKKNYLSFELQKIHAPK